MEPKTPQIHWTIALIPFLVLIALQASVIIFFGAEAIDGASQLSLLIATSAAVAISMLGYKVKWETFDNAISDNIRAVGPAIIILLLIGAVSSSWMISGIVPTMIYYGMNLVTPSLFLFTTCIICALVSVVTGSSWTTVATVGIALLGIGTAHGYSVGWTAGAIISGAYFGDKISPLSDTTVLASSVCEVSLFKHISYMLITTMPSFVITLTIFLIVSLNHPTASETQNAMFAESLRNTFTISPWLFLIPVFTAILIAMRLPASIILFLSAFAAGIAMVFVQPDMVSQIGNGDKFRGLIQTYYSDTSINTGNETLNNLVQTRGMKGMAGTIFLIFSPPLSVAP